MDNEPLRDADGLWRNEVQARVAGYRKSRGRRIEGAFSMRFPFPPPEAPISSVETEATISESAENAVGEPVSENLAPSSRLADANDAAIESPHTSGEIVAHAVEANDTSLEQDSELPPLPAPRRRRKVIAFPRPIVAEPSHYQEEPVIPEQPRILDVAEELANFPTTPLLDGLQFSSHQQPTAAAPADHVELPFQAVAVGQRLYAGLVDCTLVAASAAVCIAASYKLLPKLPLTKPLLLTLAAAPVLLWAIYEYLFIMYGGRTVGMRMAGIRLCSFKGGTPLWRQRRSRVIGLYFSTASLMMGLLWALVDVDMLCWHDRISRTYLTSE